MTITRAAKVVATAMTKAETNPAATEAEDKTRAPEEDMEVINQDKIRALEEEEVAMEVINQAAARVVDMEEISQAVARAVGTEDKISQAVAARAVDMEVLLMIRALATKARGAMEVALVDKVVRVGVLVELRVHWNQRVFKLLRALLRARDGKELLISWVHPSRSIFGAFCWHSARCYESM